MLDFIQITYQNIKFEIEKFLQVEHNKAGILFSAASPYGQILTVLENLHQLSFFYLKNSITQFDLSDPNALNERIIRNAAIAAGHNPGRGISSSGTLRFTLKTNVDLSADVPGGRVTFFNRGTIKNNTNALQYSLNIGSDKVTHKITPNFQFFLPIVQGVWTTSTFTGTGDMLQTFQVALAGQKDVEEFNYEVLVNGDFWTVKKHLWELLPDELACVVRTGFNGGMDIIFGNSGFGDIPPVGAVIQVNYVVTDGSFGNIFRRTPNDWTFITDAIDGFGNTLDVTKVFNIDIYTDINFGADKESILFTKNILPIASNNFVLALPQQYAYAIKKLGVFSHVNAYELNGSTFIVATPNIKLFKNQNANYFTIDIRAFTLDAYEISKIDLYLRTGGNILLTKKYSISSPALSYYIINVFVITYSDANDDSVNAQIIDKISEYFLNFSRIDRVPKVDIIKQIATITDINSVDIQFICKNNEDYFTQFQTDAKNKLNKFASKFNTDISVPPPSQSFNPSTSIGLDPVLGDILFDPSDIPIIRGGWYDRNGVYYSDNIDDQGLRSVNIIKQGTVDASNRPQIT
jgi:hypothetical protein